MNKRSTNEINECIKEFRAFGSSQKLAETEVRTTPATKSVKDEELKMKHEELKKTHDELMKKSSVNQIDKYIKGYDAFGWSKETAETKARTTPATESVKDEELKKMHAELQKTDEELKKMHAELQK